MTSGQGPNGRKDQIMKKIREESSNFKGPGGTEASGEGSEAWIRPFTEEVRGTHAPSGTDSYTTVRHLDFCSAHNRKPLKIFLKGIRWSDSTYVGLCSLSTEHRSPGHHSSAVRQGSMEMEGGRFTPSWKRDPIVDEGKGTRGVQVDSNSDWRKYADDGALLSEDWRGNWLE